HDPEYIWESVVWSVWSALKEAGIESRDLAATGITNQRETVVIWDRGSDKPIYNAIVWQDRRTAARCAVLQHAGHESEATARPGQLLDPYFSGTKVKWLLDTVDGARARAERGELAFGTVDSFLIWRLTGGKVHATDATNAGRTLLFDIGKNQWDKQLCELLDVPMAILPEVKDCADDFGVTEKSLFGAAI